MNYDENAMVTPQQLSRASHLVVVAQNGLRVPFGELIRERKTIVIFIRHFWCAYDQDYLYSVRKHIDSEALKRAGIDLIVIGNGSAGMIKSYRHIFRMPFSFYTDPTLRLYSALGMSLRSSDPGPDSEKGAYVKHGMVGGIAMVVRNALKVGMPVWEKGGEASQLGGEFVFGPGSTCDYAHRMPNTRSHSPILDVQHAAGVVTYASSPTIDASRSALDDEDLWMKDRNKSLERLNKRNARPSRDDLNDRWEEVDSYQDDQDGYESDSGSTSMPHSHSGWAANSTGHTGGRRRSAEDNHKAEAAGRYHAKPGRSRRTARKPTKNFHISNPDHEPEDYVHPPLSYNHGKRDLRRREDSIEY